MKKYIFLSFVAMLVFGCNTNPGITLEDLEHHDSMMLVKFDSVIGHKFEGAGLRVYETDSMEFVFSHSEASAVKRRIERLMSVVSSSPSYTKDELGERFPKGAFNHDFFVSSEGLKYRLICDLDDKTGNFWAHISVGSTENDCIVSSANISLDLDQQNDAISGDVYVSVYDVCSKGYVYDGGVSPARYLSVIHEFERMVELEGMVTDVREARTKQVG